MSESLIFPHFLFIGERCEWIAHFAQIKQEMWANRSFRSPKMSNHELFPQVAQRKWAMWANRSFRSPKMSEWVNCSFLDKKQANRSEIKWANSQPWSLQNYSISLQSLQTRAFLFNLHNTPAFLFNLYNYSIPFQSSQHCSIAFQSSQHHSISLQSLQTTAFLFNLHNTTAFLYNLNKLQHSCNLSEITGFRFSLNKTTRFLLNLHKTTAFLWCKEVSPSKIIISVHWRLPPVK